MLTAEGYDVACHFVCDVCGRREEAREARQHGTGMI